MVVSVGCREPDNRKQNQQQRIILLNEIRNMPEFRQQRLMFRLYDQFMKNQNHGRKDRENTEYAEQNTLGHNQTDIQSDSEMHEAKGYETGNRCYGTSDNRGKCRRNGFLHSIIFISAVQRHLFLKAVPQENAVIQRNTQLKDGRHGLRQIGYLAENQICSHIVNDGDANAGQKQKRQKEGIQCQHQNDHAQDNRHDNVNRRLLLGKDPGVVGKRTSAADVYIIAHHPADGINSLHGFIGGHCCFVDNRQQSTASVVTDESFPDFVRQNLRRKRNICKIIVPDDFLDIVHLLNIFFQLCDILKRHVLDNNQ